MSLSIRPWTRWLAVLLGVLGISVAINRWLWYRTLPRLAEARFCGNCFLASVGVPIELGLLGAYLLSACALNVRTNGDAFDWTCVVAGVLLTPVVLGLPVFAFGYLILILPVLTAGFRRAAALVFGA